MFMPAEPVLPESELRALAVQHIKDGRLPVALSNLIYAGYGQGVPCDLCGLPIDADDIEYNVTDPRDDGSLQFHIACHFTWQRECAQRLKDYQPPPSQG